MRDELIKLIEKYGKSHINLCAELKSVVTRHYPDRDTFDKVQAIIGSDLPHSPTDSVEIVLSPEHFGEKKITPLSRAVDAPQPTTKQDINESEPTLLERVNALRAKKGLRRMPGNAKESTLLEALAELQGDDDEVSINLDGLDN